MLTFLNLRIQGILLEFLTLANEKKIRVLYQRIQGTDGNFSYLRLQRIYFLHLNSKAKKGI